MCLFVCFLVPLVTVLYYTFQSHVRIPVVVMVTAMYISHMSWKKGTKEKQKLLNFSFSIYLLCCNCHICSACLILLQLEVGGSVTNKNLDNLISQTEYSLAVTPIYDVGPGQPMLGEAITGRSGNLSDRHDAEERRCRDHTAVPSLSAPQTWFLPRRTCGSRT